MNSFIMIGGVISAAVILFTGLTLERYIAYVRFALSLALASLIGLAFWRDTAKLLELFVSSEHIIGFWQVLTTSENRLQSIFMIALPMLSVIVSFLLHKRFPRSTSSIANFVLSFLLSLAFTIEFVPTFSVGNHLLAATVVSLGTTGFYLLSFEQYIILTSSLTGAIIIALLFSKFYYLPLWVSVIMTILFGTLGLSIQQHALRKKERTQRILNGEQTA